MFTISGTHVRLTQGDTGILTILAKETDHVFTDADKAVLTIRRPNGSLMLETVLQPEADGKVQIPFTNDLTDGWKVGDYVWDIRYVIKAVIEEGKIVDGAQVITPMAPGAFTVVKAVGKV